MSHKLLTFFASLLMLATILLPQPLPVQAHSPRTFNLMHLTPSWITGSISSSWSSRSDDIVVADLNHDGVTEIATCGVNGQVSVLTEASGGSYSVVGYSDYINCGKITSADRDSDGIRELYVATTYGQVVVLDGRSYQTLGTITLPPAPTSANANDIAVADVDGDGALEIVLARNDDTLVYDANTFALKWQATGLGGTQVAVADIDGDALPEVIVNNTPAHILNAKLKVQKWAYPAGFGFAFAVGDLDGDHLAEIAYTTGYDHVYVMDADTQTIKWQLDNLHNIESIAVADVKGDGSNEVLISGITAGEVGFQGSDGAILWNINSAGYDNYGITAGDANNDGVNEIVWGAGMDGYTSSVVVGSWVSQAVLWKSTYQSSLGPIACADLNNDNKNELVVASSTNINAYNDGLINVYDGAAHQLLWSVVTQDIYQLAVGQLDSDAALEILISTYDTWNGGTVLQAYDGITHLLEWQSPVMKSVYPQALLVKDLNGDGIDEIVVGYNRPHVQILHGASDDVLWDSGSLDGNVQGLAIGSLENNAAQDLAILTDKGVYVFEVGTWTQKLHQSLSGGQKIAILNNSSENTRELLLVTSDSSGNKTLQAWAADTFTPSWQRPLGNGYINGLAVEDVNADNIPEIIVLGSSDINSNSSSLLWIGDEKYPAFWEYQLTAQWGQISGMLLADVDNDGQNELLINSYYLLQVNKVTLSPVTYQYTYLPQLYKPLPQRGLYGKVTEKGVPAAGVPLDLRFYNGSNWSTLATATTASDGSYTFPNLLSLNPGQFYYVRYLNTATGSPKRLWTWQTQALSSYVPGSDFHIGDFDLANITLSAPPPGATISLPYTFLWIPRPTSPTDSYELDLYNPDNPSSLLYSTPQLGYAEGYTLTNRPPGFKVNRLYAWQISIYSPDGGMGVSYYAYEVQFINSGLSTDVEILPLKPQYKPGFEDPRLR
jgi:FG-GAP-like repeat